MRDYQNRKNNDYHLPPLLYKRVINLSRDYSKRIKKERDELSAKSDRTEHENAVLSVRDKQCNAIENAIESIPPEYRKGVWAKIIYDKYPEFMSESTFGRYKARFAYQVAVNLCEI